jgi:hypothetical protein
MAWCEVCVFSVGETGDAAAERSLFYVLTRRWVRNLQSPQLCPVSRRSTVCVSVCRRSLSLSHPAPPPRARSRQPSIPIPPRRLRPRVGLEPRPGVLAPFAHHARQLCIRRRLEGPREPLCFGHLEPVHSAPREETLFTAAAQGGIEPVLCAPLGLDSVSRSKGSQADARQAADGDRALGRQTAGAGERGAAEARARDGEEAVEGELAAAPHEGPPREEEGPVARRAHLHGCGGLTGACVSGWARPWASKRRRARRTVSMRSALDSHSVTMHAFGHGVTRR